MNQFTDEEMQEHYDNFFQEVFVECEVKMICILYFHDQLPHFPCVNLKNVKKIPRWIVANDNYFCTLGRDGVEYFKF